MAKSAPPPAASSWPGVLSLLLCAALWSLNGPLIKLLDREHVPGVTIACARSLLGGLVFLPLAWGRIGTLRHVRRAWPVASVLMFTLMTASFVIATTKTAASTAIILQYTSPVWVFLLSPLLLKERPGRAEGLVLLIAMAGVGIIFFGHRHISPLGLVIALLSGFGYGALTVILRGLRPVSPVVVAGMNSLGSGLLLLPALLLWGAFPWTSRATVLLLLLSLVQFTLPYVLFSWALQRVEAHRAALLVLIEALLNPLWTYLIVGEPVPGPTLAGGPLILIGVAAWLLLSRRRRSDLG
jgi:DME family drug/metabolite transporter